MAVNLKLAYEFDFVFDGQQVFRKLLDALSNPGRIENIRVQAGKFENAYPELMALGCTLLDNEETMYVEKNPDLSSELHSLTLCHEGSLDEADYVFLSSEMNYGSMEQILKNVKHGTYADPQLSATIFLKCAAIEGTEEMKVQGPGIKDTLRVNVYPYIKKVTALRDSLHIEYPLGIDLVFADTKGNIMGVPRLCRPKD
ncbi:phosphonate C-P lyase system protein PhnH [Clostridium sp. AF19-22AC]|jgi:alpha-D-ribose 1-methylphosphonate 5-triphosphate synthase subunit PhnH|uniref:phosphonate C-P lyase system protein PhnH n=1 Tax=Clostridia TaxID=186801 RepID=UPI000E505423|nr:MULTISPECIES: phosphonate C-P lyase system protein PhnH [Clostridia]RHR28059.1 phosphonate C-P lyase system protein PhnH [Clostridium sp. AF19-22AC]